MKIVSYDFEAVANSEVLKILEERGSASAGDGASILPSERRVQEYLLERATARVEAETMNRFIDAAKEFKLTKKEILQFINLRPSTQVEVYLIIENCEDRFGNDETVEKLMELVQTHLSG